MTNTFNQRFTLCLLCNIQALKPGFSNPTGCPFLSKLSNISGGEQFGVSCDKWKQLADALKRWGEIVKLRL